jgi:hypothetical protein
VFSYLCLLIKLQEGEHQQEETPAEEVDAEENVPGDVPEETEQTESFVLTFNERMVRDVRERKLAAARRERDGAISALNAMFAKMERGELSDVQIKNWQKITRGVTAMSDGVLGASDYASMEEEMGVAEAPAPYAKQMDNFGTSHQLARVHFHMFVCVLVPYCLRSLVPCALLSLVPFAYCP